MMVLDLEPMYALVCTQLRARSMYELKMDRARGGGGGRRANRDNSSTYAANSAPAKGSRSSTLVGGKIDMLKVGTNTSTSRSTGEKHAQNSLYRAQYPSARCTSKKQHPLSPLIGGNEYNNVVICAITSYHIKHSLPSNRNLFRSTCSACPRLP